MRSPTPSLRTRLFAFGLLALCGMAAIDRRAAADEMLARRAVPGREVLVRGFAEFGADCRLKHVQTIEVVDAPLHGRVVQRPGVVTVGDDWAGGTTCAGTKLDGVQVFYVPQDGYLGKDRFALDVKYARRTARATVDIEVGPDARTASN